MAAVNAGSAMVKAYLDGTALTRGLNQAQAKLRAFGQSIAAVGQRMFLLGAIGIAAGVMAARSFAQYGDAAAKMARRTGFAVEAIFELSWAAERSGADMATLEKGFRRMEATMLDAEQGLATAKLTFEMLGLSVEELTGLKPEERFAIIAARLNEIPDAGRRAAVAMEMFGRAGTMLLPMLSTVKALRAEARELGFVMSAEAAAGAEALTDAMSRLKRTFQMMLVQIGAALLPEILELLAAMMRTAVNAARWISQNKELIITLGKWALAITAAGAALLGLAMGIKIVAFALVPLQLAISAIGAVLSVVPALLGAMISGFTMLATPIGAIVAGLLIMAAALLCTTGYGAKLIAWFGKTLSWLGGVFGSLQSDATETFQGIKDAMIAGDLGLAAKILWLAVKMEFMRFAAWGYEWWVAFKDVFFGAWQDMRAGALKIVANLVDGLRAVWIIAVETFMGVWIPVQTWFAKLWNNILGIVKKAWVEIAGLLKPQAQIYAAQVQIDKATNEANRRADARGKARINRARDEASSNLAQIGQENIDTNAVIIEQRDEANVARKAQYQADLKAMQDAADAARAEWKGAIGEAARKRAEMPAPPGAPPEEKFAAQLPEFTQAVADVSEKMEARVTFAGARVAGLGLGTTAQDRIAKGTEDIVTNTRDIKNGVDDLADALEFT